MDNGGSDMKNLRRELAELRGQLDQARSALKDASAPDGRAGERAGPQDSRTPGLPFARIGELVKTISVGGAPEVMFGALIGQLQEVSGCEAVGIRLRRGDDYPYFETKGFPERFVQLENSLCARAGDGKTILDISGEPVLECMCGNVLQGRFDPSLAFFTGRGSFWSNNTTVLLAKTTSEQRQSNTRNRCNGMGYESVALVAIRCEGVTYGLFQFNDKRTDRFSPEMISFFEMVADGAALALARLQSREAQRESERLCRSILDSAGDGIFIVDESMGFVSVNQAACDRLGYSEEELLAMGPKDIDAPDRAGLAVEIAARLKREGAVVFESVHVAKHGRHIPVEINSRMLAFKGKPAYLSIARDVSERKQAVLALRENEERLRTIADFTHDWEYWRGPDGNLLWMSPSCERITGYSAGEFAADPGLLSAIVHPGDAAAFAEHEKSVENQLGEPCDLDFRIRCKSGRFVWINHSCEPIFRADGTKLGRRVSNRDITDRKRLEEARTEDLEHLRQQHEFLESLIANAPVVVGVVEGPEHRYVLANQAYEEIVEQKMRPVAGRTLAELFPAVAAEVSSLFDTIYATGKPIRLREYPVPLDGRTTWWDADYIPLFGSAGEVSRVLIIGREITELISACKQAEEESLKLKAVIDSLTEGLVVAEADGTVITINRAARRLYGLDEGREPPKKYSQFLELLAVRDLADREVPFADRPLARALRGEEFAGYEIKVTRVATGQTSVVRYSGAPVRDAAGNALFSFVSFEDVSEQRLAEAELVRQTALLTSLIDSTPDLIFIKDPNGIYLGGNPAFCDFVGLPQREIVGRSDFELFDRDIAQSLTRLDREMMDGRGSRRDDQWIVFPDGKKMLVDELRAPLCDAEGGVVGLLGVGRDITERHKLEEELRSAMQAAEKANVAKSMFLANMSHEIRTPLNGLMGMMQLMRSTPLSGEQREFADMAIRSGDRLTRLLGDILDLSRIEAGRMAIARKPFVLADIFSALADTFAPLSREKGVSIETRLCPGVPGKVLGDEVRIRQVIFNLVGNAMKFSSQGKVKVSVEALSPFSRDEARLLFTVEDTGVGIPDDKLGAVCEAFTQVDDSFTRDQQGAGLGLAITKHLVGLMGGGLAIDSELGRGTSVHFALTLGLPGGHLEEPGAGRGKAGSQGPYRILYAEDDPLSMLGVKRYLEKAGHRVRCVDNGQAVLAALAGEEFDCILMDVQMPVMDGVETTRRIRSGAAGASDRNVPVLAVTAYAMDGDMDRFLAAGMNGYIAKPLDLAELEALIDKTMAAKPRAAGAS
jgi:PAS domain S-box-containing protein